jgi:hypothetical protein
VACGAGALCGGRVGELEHALTVFGLRLQRRLGRCSAVGKGRNGRNTEHRSREARAGRRAPVELLREVKGESSREDGKHRKTAEN